jgi:cytochrome c556
MTGSFYPLNQTTETMTIKNSTILITFLAVATFAVGCKQDKTTTEQIETIKADTLQAAADMKDFTFEQKTVFVQTMTAQLKELDEESAKLAAKIDQSSQALKDEAKPKLQALREKVAKLKQDLVAVTDSTPSTWDTVKAGAKETYASVTNGFTEARQWVSEKIAP